MTNPIPTPRFAASLLALLMSFSGCADDPTPPDSDYAQDNPDPLFELGIYDVGFEEIEVSYQAPGLDSPRILPLKLWYPAQVTPDDNPTTYRVGGLVSVASQVAFNAPQPAPGAPFPVALYSHGSGGEGLLAYPYAEHMASHGWVVAAPNHVGNTALDGLQGTTAPFAAIMLHRVLDISAVLDTLGDAQTFAAADLDHVLLFGHSFGAYTTLAAGGADVDFDALQANCEAFGSSSCDFLADPAVEQAFRQGFGDERIDALVPQAPALVQAFGQGEIAALDLPTMLQTARQDQTTTHEAQSIPAWQALDGPDDIWVDMLDGGHFSFISICDDLPSSLLEQFRPDAPDDGCGPDFIPVDLALKNLRAYLMIWARLHVLGIDRDADILQGAPLDPGFAISLDAAAD